MKKYTFEVTIVESNDEFWEEVTADGKSGCDEVLALLKNILDPNFYGDAEIKLVKYQENGGY